MPGINVMKVKGDSNRFSKVRQAKAGDELHLRAAQAGKTVDLYIFDIIGWPFIIAQDLLYLIPTGTEVINVHLNTPGGDVFEGMAIYNMLASHPATVNVIVEAVAASSGSLIAMAGKTITMRPASFLMIHNCWSSISGYADELRSEAELLDKISGMFADVYAGRSGNDRAEILSMMAAETWLTPAEAVAAKMADAVDAGNVVATVPQSVFDLSVFANAPDALRAASVGNHAASGSGLAGPRRQYDNNFKEVEMNKQLRALLERLGLSKDATEDQARAFLANIDLSTLTVADERTMVEQALEDLTGGGSVNPSPPPQFSREDMEQAARNAAREERQRQAEIRDAVRAARLEDSVADDLISREVPADKARVEIFAKMRAINPPIGAGAIHMTADERDKFRSAVVDGLGLRCGLRPDKPAPGHEQFRAASIEFIARMCLERAGVDVRGLSSRNQIAAMILNPTRFAAAGSFSADDFSSIFLDVAHKTLLRAYMESPATWLPIVNVVSASDFKTIYGVSLSEAPNLDLIGPNGEYKSGEMSDHQESYSVFSYGKIIYLTRPMIINDDLRAFTRLPQLLGAAARRKESDLVWAKITGNPTMSDGLTLFHASHGNLEATAKGLVDTDKLSSGRAAMRKQTGPGGEKLNLGPAFVAVPVAQETSADVLLMSIAMPTAEMSAGVINPFAGKLKPIAEPRLDDNSVKAWYMIADPRQVDTIEVAYLDGVEAPYTEEQPLFERDAIGYKVRHDFGCGVMDFRGFYKNPGE